MAILLYTGLETHPTGTLNTGGIINGNWQKIEDFFNPASSGSVLEVALVGQAGLTTITYGASVNVSLIGRQMQKLALTGDVVIAVTDKKAGRRIILILSADGTPRGVTWPAGVTWDGSPVATVPASSTVIVEILSTSALDAGLVLRAAPVLAGFVTLAGAETLTNKTVTAGKFNQLNDTNGNESIILTATASAVNEITVANGATGNAPTITASGGDTDIDLILSGKGTGAVRMAKAILTAAALKLHADAYVQLTSSRPATDADNGKIIWSTAAYTLTFPDTLTLPFGCTLKPEAAFKITTAVSGTATLVNPDGHTGTAAVDGAFCSIDCRAGYKFYLTGKTS